MVVEVREKSKIALAKASTNKAKIQLQIIGV